MKKKILLILTFIISFILYTNNVEAKNYLYIECDECNTGQCAPVNKYFTYTDTSGNTSMVGISDKNNSKYYFNKDNCWITDFNDINVKCGNEDKITNDNILVKMQSGVCPMGIRKSKGLIFGDATDGYVPAGTTSVKGNSSYIEEGEFVFYKVNTFSGNAKRLGYDTIVVGEAYLSDGTYAFINVGSAYDKLDNNGYAVKFDFKYDPSYQRELITTYGNNTTNLKYFNVSSNFNATYARLLCSSEATDQLNYGDGVIGRQESNCKNAIGYELIADSKDSNGKIKQALDNWYNNGNNGDNVSKSQEKYNEVINMTTLNDSVEELSNAVQKNQKYTFNGNYSPNQMAQDLNSVYQSIKDAYGQKFKVTTKDGKTYETTDAITSIKTSIYNELFGVDNISHLTITTSLNLKYFESLITNRIQDTLGSIGTEKYDSLFNREKKLNEYLVRYVLAAKYLKENHSGEITSIDIDNLLEKYNNLASEHNVTVVYTCKDLLGEELLNKINQYLNIVKICIPILLIGFGIVDFTKATFANDEDAMKKSQKRFIKRIIIAIIIFLVPIFVNLILSLANEVWSFISPNSCGIFD